MGDPTDRRRLATAREAFLDGGDADLPGVPGHVAASWRRSVSSGVPPHGVASEYHTELDLGSRLVRCAEPVIEELADQVADIPMCVALTDDRARILSRRDSGSCFGRVLDRVYFAQGFGYAEGAVGTNGVGTVLEFGESVHIVGAEHFVDTLQSFACAGAPVHDPFTGRIEGVLDISCRSDHSSPIMHSLVRAAARRIENNLLLDRNPLQQALFDAYARVDARGRHAVLAVGPTVVMTNAALQTLLEARDQEALRDHVGFLLGRDTGVDDRVALPSGSTVRLRGGPVRVGGDVAGLVGVVSLVEEVDSPTTPLPLVGRAAVGLDAPPGAGRSPAWRAAAATAAAALRAGEPILVLGEPGSGRFTLLATLQRLRAGPDRTVGVPAEDVEAAPAEVAARLLRAGAGPTLPVLRDVDRLSPAAAATLAATLERAGGGAAFAATASTASGPLVTVFRASVTVPPLRHRSSDLPALAEAMLAELAPHHDVRLSPAALRLLGRHRWPGNLTELREALGAALTHRPVGAIEPGDLPASCQSAPRSALRPVDEIERDAIVTALRDTMGNRVAAAAALGLARSTLYRKIRQYGITV